MELQEFSNYFLSLSCLMLSYLICFYFSAIILDSGEVQTEENKVSLDANKKRMIKTPAQVMALENFYKVLILLFSSYLNVSSLIFQKEFGSFSEHRFLSDEMKVRMAVQIGLTEKQISGWFCHRSLKDKRRDDSYANGRQDHSSGVIQDCGSGLRQDSCGSVKGEIENPAITAVKRQLGRHYIEEGPLLGIEFDPLPPGVFEFPSSNPVNEPIYVGGHRQTHSPDISGAIKQPNLNIINEVHKSKMSSQDSYMVGAKFNAVHVSERQDRKSHHQLKYKSSFLSSNPFPGQNTSLDIYSGSTEKTAAPKNENLSRTSNLICGCGESLGTERGPSARMAKVEKLGGEWKLKKEYPVRVKIDPTNELIVAKGVNVQFPQQDFVANASHARLPQLTNQTKEHRHLVMHTHTYLPWMYHLTSSFSEDETAETSSSLD
ncbi:hypothetical protein CRYUN_Cryun03dG0123400 [Craigia yunnanensis]